MIDPILAKRGLTLVFIILLLDIIGIGIIVPVLPEYLEQLTGSNVGQAAIYGGWLLLAYAGMQFVFAPLIGNLSDRFGRRPVLLVSVVTFALDNLICALAPNFGILLVGRILAGISGGSYSTASAYIADVSTDENRAKNFGLLGIAFGVGFILGPIIGGFLGEFGPRVPFFGAALISFLNFVAAYFLLPETLGAKDRRKFEWKRSNPLGALKQMRNHKGILWIGLVFFMLTLGHMSYPAVWAYVGSYRYGWSESDIGMSLGIYGLCSAIVMGLVLPRIVSRFGEWRTAVIGLTFAALGFFGYAGAWQGWLVYVVIVATCLEGVADPAMRSIAAAKVPASEQGELQGAMTSLFSITNVIGPLIFTQIFAIFTAPDASIKFSGAPYVLGGIFVLIGLIVFVLRVEKPSLAKDEVLAPGALAPNEAG
ncbi:tetracycline resistance MFS efflux pump [Phyllobacterium brassicacearum]|uniref:Tetracycline resistance MFS efflux pump n=1 Tax=Phyllobacterium brassicacearum TaxID=314235 RepID=A0A2P7BSZ0_9HYPH|nr:TCR/Tet family MFS transporter [Phyllobacterium brassicacearum]PSH69577.1 tetracycline resistance MFS efflux pump [Phyllobacterium brassicacearum]TDQ30403.1 DHA1 family tetracycline resistance protein-like MFS transporter [Phyllobacterium brassicacearum]